jgi:hypothetical protein
MRSLVVPMAVVATMACTSGSDSVAPGSDDDPEQRAEQDGGSHAPDDSAPNDAGTESDTSTPRVSPDAGSPWITHVDNGTAAVVAAGSCNATPVKTVRPYRYYWQDDFTKAARIPDDYFAVGTKLNRINDEQQYYSAPNVTVDGAGLHLKATRVPAFIGDDGKTYTYRSGEVHTNDRGDAHGNAFQSFGRWEVCAKLPMARGSWPAIWLLRATPGAVLGASQWPPEIDIMEHVNDLNEVQTNLFWGNSAAPGSAEQRHTNIPAGGVDSFHTYAIEFTASQIDYFVDAALIRSYKTAANIPSVPMYLILDLAVGGALPRYRAPCTNFTCADGVAAYDQGVEMVVRYARAYY